MIHTPDYLVRLSGVILILGCVICPIGSLFTLTSGKFALTSNETAAGNWSMKEGSKITLNCTIAPYTHSMSWFYNSCLVYSCLFTDHSCTNILTCIDGDLTHTLKFVEDTRNGIFLMTLDPVLKQFDDKKFTCFDGTTNLTITAEVLDKEISVPDFTDNAEESKIWLQYNVGVGVLVVAIAWGGTLAIIACCLYRGWKKTTTPTRRD